MTGASKGIGAAIAKHLADEGASVVVNYASDKELGPRKIRVNAVSPGMIETQGLHAAGVDKGDFRTQTEARTPLGRIGRPDDVAPAVVFLASPEAGWISGKTLLIDGGLI